MEKVLTGDDLLTATQLPQESIVFPGFGKVFVRGMTGKQRDQWESSLMRGRGQDRRPHTENARARLAVRCLVNEKGERLYQDADAERLGNIRVDYLQKIFEVAQRLSGVTDEDIDDLGKSSGTVDGDGSSSS